MYIIQSPRSNKAILFVSVICILAVTCVLIVAAVEVQMSETPSATVSIVYQDGILTLAKDRLPKDGVSFSVFSSMNPVMECTGKLLDTFECPAPSDATLNIAGSHIVLKDPTIVGVDIFRKDLNP